MAQINGMYDKAYWYNQQQAIRQNQQKADTDRTFFGKGYNKTSDITDIENTYTTNKLSLPNIEQLKLKKEELNNNLKEIDYLLNDNTYQPSFNNSFNDENISNAINEANNLNTIYKDYNYIKSIKNGFDNQSYDNLTIDQINDISNELDKYKPTVSDIQQKGTPYEPSKPYVNLTIRSNMAGGY